MFRELVYTISFILTGSAGILTVIASLLTIHHCPAAMMELPISIGYDLIVILVIFVALASARVEEM